VDLEQRAAGRDEVADGVAHDHDRPSFAGPSHEAAAVDGLDRAGAVAADHEGGRAPGGRPVPRPAPRGRVARGGGHGCAPGARDQGGDHDRPHPVEDAVQEGQEEDDAHAEEGAGHGHAEVGDGVALDPPQE
jgi:hypothetical protein